MGAFVNRARRFFSLLAAGSVATGSRPAPGLRSLGQRRDVGERSLFEAEAAGGGGRRPAFTRLRSPTTIAWRDRGAEGMSVCRSFFDPKSGGPRREPGR